MYIILLHLDTASTAELAQAELQEVQRPPHQQQHNQVGNQEGALKYFWIEYFIQTKKYFPTAAVLVCREGEPPDVAEPHGHGDAGQKELCGVGPLLPAPSLRFLTPLRLQCSCW